MGNNGRLQTAGGFPANAAHFQKLLITLETQSNPKSPGTIVLQGNLTGVALQDGIVISAFGFQGQKCSACSRAIVVKDVYDQFLEKLRAKVEQIRIGPTDDPGAYMGAVINDSAMKSILS